MFSKTDIERYFNAEKSESLLFVGVGVLAVLSGLIFFFFIQTAFYRGAAIPLTGIGILLGVVGFTVYKRSDMDRIRNVYDYDMNRTELKEKEIPRMKTVMKNFVIYRYTEIILAVVGIVLYLNCGKNPTKIFWKGFGGALALMSLIALVADFFAERRGRKYSRGLASFINKIY